MFTYQNKPLTITRSDLTAREQKDVTIDMRLGDSEDLALWTVEHVGRVLVDAHAEYAGAEL